MQRDTKHHFPAVYVTLASVLLGLALEDLVSIVRSIDQRDAFVWITSIFIVHIIMNAWIAYSSAATSLELEPRPGDAINVFLLSAAHFALNSFIGADPAVFFLATGIYSLIAAGAVYFNALRASEDPESGFSVPVVTRLMMLNLGGGVVFLGFSFLGWVGALPRAGELVVAVALLPFASLWLLVYWRSWTASRQLAAP